MKKIAPIVLLLALGLTACEPVSIWQFWFVTAKDDSGKVPTQLQFSAEGGTQTLFVETTLPYWMCRPTSLNGMVYSHPVPDSEGYIEVVGLDGWMTLKFRHRVMGPFDGTVEVIVAENSTGAPRTDGIYLWNDDIPAGLTTSVTIQVRQE